MARKPCGGRDLLRGLLPMSQKIKRTPFERTERFLRGQVCIFPAKFASQIIGIKQKFGKVVSDEAIAAGRSRRSDWSGYCENPPAELSAVISRVY